MRKQPLLALASTTIALSTAGVAAAETDAPQPVSTPHVQASHLSPTNLSDVLSHPDSVAIQTATLVTDLRTSDRTRSFTSAARGDYAVAALSFAVRGEGVRVLGTWESPTQRLLARQRAIAARQRARLAVRRARAAAHARKLLAERHAAALRAATRAKRVARLRHAAAAAHRAVLYQPAGGVWASLRQCESGGNYQTDTGNGYYGAYQFSLQTWWGLGFSGLPNQASPAVQDRAAHLLESLRGWSPWPVCSVTLGLR